MGISVSSSGSPSRFHLTGEDIINECKSSVNFNEKSVLITGGTNGIGLETCRVLACAGANVYALGRDQSKLENVVKTIQNELKEKTSNGSIQGYICDLNSFQSIKEFADKFEQDRCQVNILILNAGITNFNYVKTIDELEQTIGVNHIGQAYLTKLLLPNLIANCPSRIVVVSSDLHAGPPLNYPMLDQWNSGMKNGWHIARSYQQSKLANVLFARALASRFQSQQITAYSLHPGVIKTNLGSGIPLLGLAKSFLKTKTMSEGVATSIFCAIKTDLENETGKYFADSTVQNDADKWTEQDLEQFWNWTEKIIQDKVK